MYWERPSECIVYRGDVCVHGVYGRGVCMVCTGEVGAWCVWERCAHGVYRRGGCMVCMGEVCAWCVRERCICACMTGTSKSYSPGVKSCDSSTRRHPYSSDGLLS